MHYSPILAPVVALIAWSLVMMVWLYASRGAAFKKAGVTLTNIPTGARGADFDGQLDPRAQWKAHNYNHLMEQPTLFYTICLVLAFMDFGGGINLWFAWGYVAFRVLHSIVQATVNVVRYRFALHTLASFCLLGLTVHAGARIIHDCLG